MSEQIARGLRSDATADEELRHCVAEVLAEGYTYVLANEGRLLPADLREEIERAIQLDPASQGAQLELGDVL